MPTIEMPKEMNELMLKIMRKELTICETCDTLFDYRPQKRFCDECNKKKVREYRLRPEVKAKQREWHREYRLRPEVKAKKREYEQRPEVKAKQRERDRIRYLRRNKKLREEE